MNEPPGRSAVMQVTRPISRAAASMDAAASVPHGSRYQSLCHSWCDSAVFAGPRLHHSPRAGPLQVAARLAAPECNEVGCTHLAR